MSRTDLFIVIESRDIRAQPYNEMSPLTNFELISYESMPDKNGYCESTQRTRGRQPLLTSAQNFIESPYCFLLLNLVNYASEVHSFSNQVSQRADFLTNQVVKTFRIVPTFSS